MLGYAGLIPFIISAAGIWFASDNMVRIFDQALLTYAACILAFMGAIHWGQAMLANSDSWQLGLSVIPSLFAWLALNVPSPWGYSILIICFAVLCVVDSVATRFNLLPAWYPRMRIPLTVIVVVSLIIGAFGSLNID
jgi:hypothetical protein